MARMTSLEPVHSGLKTASSVRVRTDETPSVNTPFEGSVKGVQWALVDVVAVAVVDTLPMLMSCLATILSIIISLFTALPQVVMECAQWRRVDDMVVTLMMGGWRGAEQSLERGFAMDGCEYISQGVTAGVVSGEW